MKNGQDLTINKLINDGVLRKYFFNGVSLTYASYSPVKDKKKNPLIIWMDGFTGFGDGTSKYEKALMGLIQEYVRNNKDIDSDRNYIGGDLRGI